LQRGLQKKITRAVHMSELLNDVKKKFDREDQQVKRDIAEYLYRQPGQWIAKQELADLYGIDESGVGRHLDDLHDFGAIQSKTDDTQRFVKWDGRGVGGLRYWTRRAIPDELWVVGEDLRAFLTPSVLGGAFVPTLAFVLLLCLGLATALFTTVLMFLPVDSLLGVTVVNAFAITGLITMLASVLLALVPAARLLEAIVWRVWPQMDVQETNRNSEE
jgi:hypothetical protein